MKQRLPLQRLWRMVFCPLAIVVGANSAVANPTEAQLQSAFAEHFANYDIPPEAYEQAEGAVDLANIHTPVEAPTSFSSQSLGEGTASFYGQKFNGRRTASGEKFDMKAFTAAHRTLPFGSMVRVTNLANGRAVVVRINDRGPHSRTRLIDLSRAAATEIGLIARGHGKVRLELVEE